MSTHIERLGRAMLSLDGLSVGDGFGQRFFYNEDMTHQRALPKPPWLYTDDTIMAMAIIEVLAERQTIDQDALAERFAQRYADDPCRGYGATAIRILQAIGAGTPWQHASGSVYDGTGSMGNGGAMRVAPLGAYFADDLEAAAQNARASAEVTHMHIEGIAGAIAIAVVAASAANGGRGQELFDAALKYTPECQTRNGIANASRLPMDETVRTAAQELGNGSRIIAIDTVPFTIWCAAKYIDNFEEAMWQTASGGGDMDTTCAIVGGIVALGIGRDGIPADWLKWRERLNIGRSEPGRESDQ